MKKIFLIILFLFGICFCGDAQESNKRSVALTTEILKRPQTTHRIPLKVQVEVFYDTEDNSLEVISQQELSGEVYLYKDGNPIDYSSSINVVFLLPESIGFYTIVIITDFWTATGSLEL